MERISLDRNSVVAGGVLGLLGGFAVGYLVCRRTYRLHLDAEVAAAKSHYQSRLKSEVANIGIVAARAATYNGSADETASSVEDGSVDDGDEGDAEDYPAESSPEPRTVPGVDVDGKHIPWPPVNRDTTKPYVISELEYGECEIGWQQLSIVYYNGDKILVDDKEQPIRDIRGVTGPVVPEGFGGVSGDPSIRYVRNERLELDFEIVLDERSYADVVLNYGNPNRSNQ